VIETHFFKVTKIVQRAALTWEQCMKTRWIEFRTLKWVTQQAMS